MPMVGGKDNDLVIFKIRGTLELCDRLLENLIFNELALSVDRAKIIRNIDSLLAVFGHKQFNGTVHIADASGSVNARRKTVTDG